jgi:hypothetical protein
MEWSGRAPAPPACDVGRGCQWKERSHVQHKKTGYSRDGHRLSPSLLGSSSLRRFSTNRSGTPQQ